MKKEALIIIGFVLVVIAAVISFGGYSKPVAYEYERCYTCNRIGVWEPCDCHTAKEYTTDPVWSKIMWIANISGLCLIILSWVIKE